MNENETYMFMIRKLIERGSSQAIKDGGDPAVYEMGLRDYHQEEFHYEGDVNKDSETGQPFECLSNYDGALHKDWNLYTPGLWKKYHGRDKEHAYPWTDPSGAHDMYKANEFMTWIDGFIYKCLKDTNFNPEVDPTSWEKQ